MLNTKYFHIFFFQQDTGPSVISQELETFLPTEGANGTKK